jgi:RNA polymerase sigma-70 factor (ECF subfamily)
MAAIPREQRTAIVLKEYHGLTFQEIADLQGCPLSTVKTRLYQGLTRLRQELEHRGIDREAAFPTGGADPTARPEQRKTH